ncbi:Protein HEXIM [Trichinella murrelli]|uniref:Protein HEXIM n=1 Tax=Trichinella murrelli TaxID=144512 RepID=A0A0V0U9Q0_9BILA|nr:Protein HEXIM [Trichinella murrelli]
MQTDDNEGLSFSSGEEARSSILTHPDGEQGAAVGEQFQSVTPSCDRTENSSEVVSLVFEAGGSSESRGDDQQLEATAGKPKRKKRTRRPVRRPWKPYFKLSLEERQRLELREERRAERIRAQRFAHGLPVAPYNTTQFLLDDREARESEPICVDEIVDTIRHQGAVNDHHGHTKHVPNHHHHHHHSDHMVGDEYSSDSVTTSEGDLCMLEREFDYEYETAHAERLEEMSKEQLVQEYIHLEKELERYQSESAQLRSAVSDLAKRCSTCGHNDVTPPPPPPPPPRLLGLADGEEHQQNGHSS